MSQIESYYKETRKELIDILPIDVKTVLEVGCGAGYFSSSFREKIEYWGIEPNVDAYHEAQNKLYKALHGTYEETQDHIPNNYFDLIICNDVIEHMPDHEAFLETIRVKLNEHGCILASIPNVRYLPNLWKMIIEKDWQYENDGILDRTHLRFFTERSIKRILRDQNYSIDIFTGLNPLTTESRIKRLIFSLLSLVLGKDTNYLQFGVLFRPRKSNN